MAKSPEKQESISPQERARKLLGELREIVEQETDPDSTRKNYVLHDLGGKPWPQQVAEKIDEIERILNESE